MAKHNLTSHSFLFGLGWLVYGKPLGPLYIPPGGGPEAGPASPDHDRITVDPTRNPAMNFPRWFCHLAGQGGNDTTVDAAVNASGGAVEYYVQAPDDEKWLVNRLLVQLVDEKDMQPAGDYGSIGTALTNGITMWREDADGNKVHDIVAATAPIKSNADWAVYSHDVEIQNWTNATDEALSVRWDLSAAGVPVVLLPGEKLVIEVHDDLSDLTAHHFAFQGASMAYSE